VRNYLAQADRLQARWVWLRNLREGKPTRGNERDLHAALESTGV